MSLRHSITRHIRHYFVWTLTQNCSAIIKDTMAMEKIAFSINDSPTMIISHGPNFSSV